MPEATVETHSVVSPLPGTRIKEKAKTKKLTKTRPKPILEETSEGELEKTKDEGDQLEDKFCVDCIVYARFQVWHYLPIISCLFPLFIQRMERV